MRTLLEILDGLQADKEDCVLVTITAAYGSTPGRVGASMVVTKQGRRFGTIGGGAVEKNSELLAVKLLAKKQSHLERYRLHQNEIADIGMICGGENDVYFRYISAEDEETCAVVKKALEWIRQGQKAWMIQEITEEENGKFILYSEEERPKDLPEQISEGLLDTPALVSAEGRDFFLRKLTAAGKVYLFGAGHISQALAPLLVKLQFACGVYDDREEFLSQACFENCETVKIDPTDISSVTEKIGAADYICIMTHGHKDDFEIQRQVMKTGARYIGVIGSARKQKAVKEKILALGFTEEDFRNVVSPIGLNIGADTPEEIAVCIAAQLIMVRSGRGFGEKDWKR